MKNKLLIIFLVMGFLIRVVGLSSRPLGFTWDEAAIGYNAFSLLQTGRDEHGVAFPVIFKSFGDFKPGLYIYFTVLPVRLFGLTEFSTRLPSAVFGTLSILLIWLLVRKIFSRNIASASALLFAINPLMINFSRGAWEANLSLFLLLLITNLFIKSRFWLTSLISGLSLYAYQGAKLNVPFVLLFLFVAFKPKISKIFLPGIFLLILALPVILGLSSQSGRLKVFSVFSYTRSKEYVQNLVSQDPAAFRPLLAGLFHSEKLDQFRGITQRFLNHLSPRYLFIEGNWSDHRQSVVYYGNFHLFEVITFILGFFILAKKSLRSSLLLITLIVGFILPSALSRDIVTSVRSLPLVIPLTIISAVGLNRLTFRKISLIFIIPVIIFSLVYFLDLYFRHTPYFYAADWLYPYQPAVTLVGRYQSDYSRVYFTDKLGQPYIFFLFYLKYPPWLYQTQSAYQEGQNGDVGRVTDFSRYNFGPIYWPTLRGQKDIMVIGDEFELPEKDLDIPNLVNYGDIKYPNGQIGLRVVGLKNYYAQK